MAHDFENIDDIDDLSDRELKELVRAELDQHPTLDADSILVKARDGVVELSGRVGTEAERRIAAHIVTDVLGISRFDEDLVVDEVRRDLAPEAADNAAVEEAALGHSVAEEQQEPSAAHLVENLDGRLYGSPDVEDAIERAEPWVPPEGPTPEGLGEDAGYHDPQDEIPRTSRHPRRDE